VVKFIKQKIITSGGLSRIDAENRQESLWPGRRLTDLNRFAAGLLFGVVVPHTALDTNPGATASAF
jgi:hypothetical protein